MSVLGSATSTDILHFLYLNMLLNLIIFILTFAALRLPFEIIAKHTITSLHLLALFAFYRKPTARLRYSEPVVVEPDSKKIQRQLLGKFFIKNSTQTYFYSTVPRHIHTYSIHPELDSEYVKCW